MLTKPEKIQLQKVNLDLNLYKQITHPQRIEISGSSNVGTTAFSLYITKKFDDAGMTCLFVDISRRLTKQYLLQNAYYDYLSIVSATTTSEIYDIVDEFKNSADLIIFDDIAGISTGEKYKERHKELLKNLINYLNREIIHNTVIYINQLRIDPISNRPYYPYGYLLDVDSRIILKKLEEREHYRIIQGHFEKNNFGTEDYFSFRLFQDRLEGVIK